MKYTQTVTSKTTPEQLARDRAVAAVLVVLLLIVLLFS